MNIEEGKERGVTSGDQPGVANYPPQPVPAYPVCEAREHDRLPCWGLGYGWLLLIVGFVFGIIPWYVGTILLLCNRNKDKREKPGYIACAIMAVIGTVLVILSLTTDYGRHWYRN